jgi:hypothetical protein
VVATVPLNLDGLMTAQTGRLTVNEPYALAQRAMADLKAAIYLLLKDGPGEGLRNIDIGRALGIYAGHVGHEGHIPRTLLALMESEGVVRQDGQTKLWTIRLPETGEDDGGAV